MQRLAFSGIFFALILIFQSLDRFMPFAKNIMNINLTLLFILPIFYFAGPLYGIIIIIIRFVIGPSMGDLGYTDLGIIGQFALSITTLVAVFFQYIFSYIFRNVKNLLKKYFLIVIPVIILTSLLLTLLNGIFITPLYYWRLGYTSTLSISESMDKYFPPMYFGMPTYWGGICFVYILGNVISLSIVYTMNYPLSKIIKHFYN